MKNTTHYNIPYPEAGDSGWQNTMEDAIVAVDSALYERELAIKQTTGFTVTASGDIDPNTLVGSGISLPSGTQIGGMFTISKLVDDIFSFLSSLLNGTDSFNFKVPEGAYLGANTVSSGSAFTCTMGPIVQIRNDASNATVAHMPAFVSNRGGIVGGEPGLKQYPVMIPPLSDIPHLSTLVPFALGQDYTDLQNFGDDEVKDTAGINVNTFNGTYKGGFFNYDNMAASEALVIEGTNGQGTVRIYGTDINNVDRFEDVTISGPFSETTVRTNWKRITGICYKGFDLLNGTTEYTGLPLNQTQVDMTIYSPSKTIAAPIAVLESTRDYRSMDGGVKRARQYFNVSWECISYDFLWSSYANVEGIPFAVVGVGLLNNREAYLSKNLKELTSISGVGGYEAIVHSWMVDNPAPIPSTFEPMRIYGISNTGVPKYWKVYPTIKFSTLAKEEYFDSKLNLTPTGDYIVPPINVTTTKQDGTAIIVKYEFPTDIKEIAHILWANNDECLQYKKILGMAIAAPVGRILGSAAKSANVPVKLWTESILDNYSKFAALMDMVVGYLMGMESGRRYMTLIESLAGQLGLDSKQIHMIFSVLPIYLPLVKKLDYSSPLFDSVIENLEEIRLPFGMPNYQGIKSFTVSDSGGGANAEYDFELEEGFEELEPTITIIRVDSFGAVVNDVIPATVGNLIYNGILLDAPNLRFVLKVDFNGIFFFKVADCGGRTAFGAPYKVLYSGFDSNAPYETDSNLWYVVESSDGTMVRTATLDGGATTAVFGADYSVPASSATTLEKLASGTDLVFSTTGVEVQVVTTIPSINVEPAPAPTRNSSDYIVSESFTSDLNLLKFAPVLYGMWLLSPSLAVLFFLASIILASLYNTIETLP